MWCGDRDVIGAVELCIAYGFVHHYFQAEPFLADYGESRENRKIG